MRQYLARLEHGSWLLCLGCFQTMAYTGASRCALFVTYTCLPLDITLDPGFKNFYFWCKENGIPFVIVSR
jgi:hypothetical protein